MPKECNLTYSIIIPAYNEEQFIIQTLQSVQNQTYLPNEVIVVNDNSTDNTLNLIQDFCALNNLFSVITTQSSINKHSPGSKVVEAFYDGFNQLKKPWDIIVKLDADVILPPNYFEEIIHAFQTNKQVGIVGGLMYILKDNSWIYESIANKNHVRGPIKAYCKNCFESIGGLKKSIGWDTVDVLLANYNGFSTLTLKDLMVKHLKPTGNSYKKEHGKKMGKAFKRMRYGLLLTIIAASKASLKAKNGMLFFNTLQGFFIEKEHIVTKPEGRFIRKYRWQNILKKSLNYS